MDPAKNGVRVSNSPSEPLAVTVVGSGSARKPFQKGQTTTVAAGSAAFFDMEIPAGKRFVIENISASADCAIGQQIFVEFSAYLDNGDGVVNGLDMTNHRIVLNEQGTFNIGTHFAANHQVLVFADSQIGAMPLPIRVTARLSSGAGNGIFRVTFSGYVEDLPTTP